MYEITSHSKKKAKAFGVDIKPSANKNKKIDVFKDDKKIATIGAIGYKDYGTYLQENGKEFAEKKRQLYRQRHKKDLNSKNGLWANRILW